MMFVTRTIDSSQTPLLIGKFYDDSVEARTPDGKVFVVPRFDIETPVLVCNKCGKSALLKTDKRTKREYAECPDHNRHMYEELYGMANDVKKYDRNQRRKYFKSMVYWLNKWKNGFETKTQQKVNTDVVH